MQKYEVGRNGRRAFVAMMVIALMSLGLGCDKLRKLQKVAKGVQKVTATAPKVTILTGSKTGNYFKAATELGTVLPADETLDIQESAGSYENLKKLGTGQANLAIAQFDTVMMFLKMGGTYQRMAQNSVVIAPLGNEVVHIIVNKKAKIHSIKDLKGKRLAAGGETSGSFVSAFTIMSYFDGVNLQKDAQVDGSSYDQALEKLAKGELDAVFITTAPGMPLLKGLSADMAKSVELLDVGKSVKLPSEIEFTYVVTSIPAGTYPWQTKAVNALATPSYLLAYSGYQSTHVRKIAKAIYENGDKLKAQSADIWANATRDRAKQDMQNHIPYHPGARAYVASGI